VALVASVRPVTTLEVSPLTRPWKLAVKTGLAVSTTRVALLAAMVSAAGVTVSVPGT
jgi:hypothetical protein